MTLVQFFDQVFPLSGARAHLEINPLGGVLQIQTPHENFKTTYTADTVGIATWEKRVLFSPRPVMGLAVLSEIDDALEAEATGDTPKPMTEADLPF